MSQPLSLIPLTSFLGTHEDTNTVILQDFYSPSGSQNVYVDKRGRIRKIPGYIKINESAFTLDTSGDNSNCKGLFNYRTVSGVTTTRHLIFVLDDETNEWEIWKSTDGGATASFLKEGATGSHGRFADFAQYKSNLYITNGIMDPQVYDGSSIADVGLTASPTVSSSSSTDGDKLNGQYKWKLVSVEADGTRHGGSAASTNLLLEDEAASLTWTADSDGDVVGYELWRTTGTGEIYYFVSMIDGRTTAAFTDNIPDAHILTQRALDDHGEAPVTGLWFCELHKDRMWWFRTDSFPTRGWYSDPGLPESVGSDQIIDFSDNADAGDVITGALGDFEGRLLVFTRDAIWSVSGSGAVIGGIRDWTRRKSNAKTGPVSSRAVWRVPRGAAWVDEQGQIQTTQSETIAYFSSFGDIRLFDGTNDTVISHPITQTLDDNLAWTNSRRIFAVHDLELNHIMWFFPTGSNTACTQAVVWNYHSGSWHVFKDFSPTSTVGFGAGIELDSNERPSYVILGRGDVAASSGHLYFWRGSNDFDGNAIDARWMTGTLRGLIGQDPNDNAPTSPAMSHTKRWRWADLLIETNGDATLTLAWFRGDASGTASALGSRTFSPDDTNRLTTHYQALLKTGSDYVTDHGIRLRLSDDATDGQWSVEGITLAYQLLEGLKRRIQ